MSEGYNVTWSERRSVNVGNYESREVFVSISRVIDRHNHIVSTESVSAKAQAETLEDVQGILQELKETVQDALDREERKIRKRSVSFVDFDTVKKMPVKKKVEE